MYDTCLTCPFFRDLSATGDKFVSGVFTAIGEDVSLAMQTVAVTCQ